MGLRFTLPDNLRLLVCGNGHYVAMYPNEAQRYAVVGDRCGVRLDRDPSPVGNFIWCDYAFLLSTPEQEAFWRLGADQRGR